MKFRFFLFLAVVAWVFPVRADNEIGFIEKFALATDREAVLTQLIPGSEEFYFYHALHYQNTGQAAKLKEILETWSKRFPDSGSRKTIENRSALIGYATDPESTLKFLREKLHVDLNHEPEVRNRPPDLPAKLDPAAISREVFQRQALSAGDDLKGFSDQAAEALVEAQAALKPSQRRALLARLKRPDVPGLIDLVEADLKNRESRGFGEFPIHKLLLPEQLAELVRRIPSLAENQAFVFARMRQLLPGADIDLEEDSAEREAWLDRTWAYVAGLSPTFNSLKTQVLYRRLQHDRTKGIYDKARFLEYLRLPRRVGYMNSKYLDRPEMTRYAANLGENYSQELPQFQPVGNDEPLVREYLLELLSAEDAWEPWAVWLRDSYVKPVFAEAKIVHGIGDPEKWASFLSPTEFKQLKDRVDVDFAPNNARLLAPSDKVSVTVTVKNAPKLIIKIYELNTLSFFLAQKRQLNTDLKLDGLVANSEKTLDLGAEEAGRSPFRRVARTLDFPELKGRGAWIVEFIGGGKSSRALIRKGHWQLIQQSGPAGDMLTVLDESFAPVIDATAWLDGRKFTPDAKTGFIVVPFAAAAATKPVILADAAGTFATLTQFEQHVENYRLDAQFHIEREQLIARREATLAMRTALLLGDIQIPLSLLQDVKLTLTTTSLEGVATSTEVKAVTLEANRLFTTSFQVPDRLASVDVALSARIENLSAGGRKDELTASHTFTVNGIDRSEVTSDGRFSKFGEQIVFDLLGKNGEPIPNAGVTFHFHHREFTGKLDMSLRTDEQGRIALGKLDGIRSVEADTPGGRSAFINFNRSATTVQTLHVPFGETVRIPWLGTAPPKAGDISLLEQRGGTFVKNLSSSATFAQGFVELKALPPGDYSLLLRGDGFVETKIAVAAGTRIGQWVMGAARQLEIRQSAPVHIEGLKLDPDAVVIQLRNVNPMTRVHVAATRFVPLGPLFEDLAGFPRFVGASAEPEHRPNLYSTGRAIGDEYRYILERRSAKTFPGNILPRPGLLLNPWEVRATNLDAQSMATAEEARRSAGDRDRRAKVAESAAPLLKNGHGKSTPGSNTDANLDFLGESSVALYNLVPDAAGLIRIDRKALGGHSHVQVYAEDLQSAEGVAAAYPEVPPKLQDLRLSRGLDPAKPFTERKEATILAAGQTLTFADVLTSEFSTYDSIASVHALLSTLNPDASLAKFAFILTWPKLKDEEKQAKYSEFACHELNFFLSRKDPAFFAKVVQPYLRNKKDKTFMDDYLLETDLKRYVEPWAYGQLNMVERALLARRLPGEAAAAARHLSELWEMLKPDPEEQDRLFETALRGRALNEDEAVSSLRKAKVSLATASESTFSFAGASMPASAQTRGTAGNRSGTTEIKQNNLDVLSFEVPAATPAAAAMPVARDSLADGAAKLGDIPVMGYLFKDSGAIASDTSKFEVTGGEVLGREQAQELRRAVRQYYRALGPTKEWAENNYYHLPVAQQGTDLVTINAFWRDYAAWDGKAPFLSEHLIDATRNFTEMMLTLAVLDLPFEAAKHTSKTEGAVFTFTAGGPVIVFHKQIKAAAGPANAGVAAGSPELLVSQNFFRANDRYLEEGNEKFDKYVTDEFLVGVVYGAKIVITNPGSAPAKIELLLQIPQGAMAVSGSKPTDSKRLRLEPYSTQTFEYFFYFPATGAKPFDHYPVNVARNEQVVGAAKAWTFKVVKQLSQVDKTSWDYLSQEGSEAEVFTFLEKANLSRLNLAQIAWRARKSETFYKKITEFLTLHHVWSEPIYRYALLHNDTAGLREWLRHRDDFIAECGSALESKLLIIDPIERRAYEHLEYSPLVNQRVHRLGAENKVPNPVVRTEYQHLLDILAHRRQLDAGDQLSVVYQLFLQDRVEEALARLHDLKPDQFPTRLQFDYLTALADLYEEKLADARKLATAYASYPVDRWRNLFAEVAAELDEIDGKPAAARPGEPNREDQQSNLAATEPAFELKVENKTLSLTWKNLTEVTINYYLMDPEFLFSSSPFVTQDSGRFAIVKPTLTATQALPAGKDALDIPLPDTFTKSNVLVEVLAAGQRKAQPYHANTLKLAVAENYGRLDVRDALAGKPVSKVYVKVYARLKDGAVRFAKDGYTDLRGRFDYANLNSSSSESEPPPLPSPRPSADGALDYQMLRPSELASVERLAILVMSDAHGAATREAAPPSQ